ncbi:MAG: inositol monophosphatase family protein [Candidatus Omnitrophota bacterium]
MNKKFKKVAIDAALKSGNFIKNSVGRIVSVSYKGRDNIVTDVDEKSEDIVIRMIRSHFPDHSILSEECGVIDRMSSYKWIIDPLDGTTNFAHAFPFFCVSIALEENGRVILGVVYDPMRDELFYAEAGKGAYLNSKPISVSKVKTLTDSFLATGFSYGAKRKDKNLKNFKRLLTRSMAVRRAGSAALDLSYVACGRFDGFWEMDLKPWDSAAGCLLVKEAKGNITKFNGSKYTIYDNNVLATNGKIHSCMVKLLKT